MASGNVKIDLRGPMFSARAPSSVKRAIRDGLAEVADETQGFVQDELYPGHGFITGFLKGSVAGHVISDFRAVVDAGQISQGANVVYARPIERRYGMFATGTRKGQRLDFDRIFGDRVRRVLNG